MPTTPQPHCPLVCASKRLKERKGRGAPFNPRGQGIFSASLGPDSSDRTREGDSGEGDMASGIPQLPPAILLVQELEPNGRGSLSEREEKRPALEEAVPQVGPTPGTGMLRGRGEGN